MRSFKTQVHGIRSRRPKGSVIIKVECLLKRSHCDEETAQRRAECFYIKLCSDIASSTSMILIFILQHLTICIFLKPQNS